MVDGALGLLFCDRLEAFLGQGNWRRVSLIEMGVSILMLALHYFLLLNANYL
jgi:hypothetical protein